MPKTAEYKNPPLNEVVYGMRFDPLDKWLIPHVGEFWGLVSDDFPQVAHGPYSNIASEPLVPRTWLINSEDDRLIQIQNGEFFYNWRRRKGEYPRYNVLSKEFLKYLKKFEDFCEKRFGDISAQQLELSYINHLEGENDWRLPKGLRAFIPALSEVIDIRNDLRGMNTTLDYVPDSNYQFQITLRSATRGSDKMPILILQLVARGLPKDGTPNSMAEWFSKAHDDIVLQFDRITSDEAKDALWR